MCANVEAEKGVDEKCVRNNPSSNGNSRRGRHVKQEEENDHKG